MHGERRRNRDEPRQGKTAQEDEWLDHRFAGIPLGVLTGGPRPDPTYNRISTCIASAVGRFDATHDPYWAHRSGGLTRHGGSNLFQGPVRRTMEPISPGSNEDWQAIPAIPPDQHPRRNTTWRAIPWERGPSAGCQTIWRLASGPVDGVDKNSRFVIRPESFHTH